MEVKKKKNKFQRVLKKSLRNIVKFFVGLKNKFMSLNVVVRRVIYIWCIVLVVILFLVLLSNKNSNRLEKYKKMEQNLVNATLDYVNEYKLYPDVNQKLKLELEMLQDLEFVTNEDIPDKTCLGYSIVYYSVEDEEYNVNSYLNCKKYTTENFSMDYNQ